jgi:hypothetical protein
MCGALPAPLAKPPPGDPTAAASIAANAAACACAPPAEFTSSPLAASGHSMGADADDGIDGTALCCKDACMGVAEAAAAASKDGEAATPHTDAASTRGWNGCCCCCAAWVDAANKPPAAERAGKAAGGYAPESAKAPPASPADAMLADREPRWPLRATADANDKLWVARPRLAPTPLPLLLPAGGSEGSGTIEGWLRLGCGCAAVVGRPRPPPLSPGGRRAAPTPPLRATAAPA